ncbi:MAG: adenosylcobinamide-GDP ribazoletransferase [Candidatus Obscuribacterales bacterium]|nr:adenosylcobinamide-GDP ribazoletransferase [Candidatus Obscuribacterales bacterium]
MLKKIVLTASFVTACPYLKTPAVNAQDLNGLAKFLPLIGIFIGCFLAAASFLLFSLHTPPLISGFILTFIWLLATGGIHLDGLMDTADGIFSHRSRERMLEIMHDSRVGNFGALSGLGIVLGKFAALSCLPFAPLMVLLLIVPTWSRWAVVFAVGCFPYAREEGMGKIWHESTKTPTDLISSALPPLAITALVCYFCGHPEYACFALFSIIGGLAAAFALNRILHGHTGDTYGAVAEIAETTGLVCSVIMLNNHCWH